jgi:hypothetical protein
MNMDFQFGLIHIHLWIWLFHHEYEYIHEYGGNQNDRLLTIVIFGEIKVQAVALLLERVGIKHSCRIVVRERESCLSHFSLYLRFTISKDTSKFQQN